MKVSWDRGRVQRIGLAIALAGLLVPNLLAQPAQVARAQTYSVSKFDIATRDAAEVRPRVDGNLAVWQDYRDNSGADIGENANADIRYADISGNDNSSSKANEDSKNSKRPDVSGDTIVWTQDSGDPTHGLDIRGYKVNDDDHFVVDNDNSDQDFPAISGNVVVYQTMRSGNWDIRGYDIHEDHHFDVVTQSADQTHPAIDGDVIVWEDHRAGGGRTDIWGYRISSPGEFRITNRDDAREPAISGNNLVFTAGATDNAQIWLHNLDTGTETPLSSTTEHHRGNPRISGNIVVWEDEREGAGRQDIWGYDLSTGQEFPVVTGGDDQYDPDVTSSDSGTTFAWTDESHSGDVIGARLTVEGLATAVPTTAPTSAPPTLGPTPNPGPPAQRDERFFPQSGFRIDNDKIWDYFQHRGKVNAFGYPISRTFRFLGFTTQFFQRHIVQIGPDGNARLLNLLDPGLMPVDRINGSTFPSYSASVANLAPVPGSAGYDVAVQDFIRTHAPETFNGQPVRFWTKFNNTVTCQDAFPNQPCQDQFLPGFNLEMAGIPTSDPMADPANG